MSTDAGKTWGESTLVLSTTLQPGHEPAETIAGKYFPSLRNGTGGMVLLTDGGPGFQLHAYLSKSAGDMTTFVPATQPAMLIHPPAGNGTPPPPPHSNGTGAMLIRLPAGSGTCTMLSCFHQEPVAGGWWVAGGGGWMLVAGG
jgi:hypothetical protein